MKNYIRILVFTIQILTAAVLLNVPVRAEGWKFKPASSNAVPWNKAADDFMLNKTGSENSVLKMRLSGVVNTGKDKSDTSVSKNSSKKKTDNTKKTDSKKNTGSKDKTGKDKVLRGTVPKDTLSEDTALKNTVSENGSEKRGIKNDWKLILVNKQNPIPDDYEAEMVPIGGGITIREEVVKPLEDMIDAAAKEGIQLMVCSGYRSHAHQQELFDRKIRNYTGKGLSYLDAFRIGSYSVIIPGTSEHELGMALDIVAPGYTSLNEGFEKTDAGRWLKNNAFKYGFILRYPKGKEYITGIIFEPWHYRYVGKEAAVEIRNSGLTLEEYIEEQETY